MVYVDQQNYIDLGRGYIDQAEVYGQDVVRGRYTSVGRYKPRIDLIQKLQLLYY